jgi:hypothetical protein
VKVIEKNKTGSGRSAGVVDQSAIDIEENHFVKGSVGWADTRLPFVGERLDSRQFLAFQKFQRCSAAG